MSTEEKIYKSSEIAEALGVTQITTRAWVTKGELVGYFVKTGKKKTLFIKESELKRFLEKKPRYKDIWENPIMRQAPYAIKVYINERLAVLRELHIDLTTEQMLHLWSLRTEFDIDAFLHDVIIKAPMRVTRG